MDEQTTPRDSLSSVEITRDAKGAHKIVVKVYRAPGLEDEAAAKTKELFDALAREYPA